MFIMRLHYAIALERAGQNEAGRDPVFSREQRRAGARPLAQPGDHGAGVASHGGTRRAHGESDPQGKRSRTCSSPCGKSSAPTRSIASNAACASTSTKSRRSTRIRASNRRFLCSGRAARRLIWIDRCSRGSNSSKRRPTRFARSYYSCCRVRPVASACSTTEAIEQQNLRGLQSPPSWNGYYFYRHGERRADNCAACPVTASTLEFLPLSHVRESRSGSVVLGVHGGHAFVAPSRRDEHATGRASAVARAAGLRVERRRRSARVARRSRRHFRRHLRARSVESQRPHARRVDLRSSGIRISPKRSAPPSRCSCRRWAISGKRRRRRSHASCPGRSIVCRVRFDVERLRAEVAALPAECLGASSQRHQG